MKSLYICSLGLLLLTQSLLELCAGYYQSMRLSHNYICGLGLRISSGCSWAKPELTSQIHCAVGCNQDDSCIGISLDQNQACFHHMDCPSVTCTEVDYTHTFFQGCPNGFWNIQLNKCGCPYGRSGDNCEIYPKTCRDIFTDGFPNGRFKVLLDPESSGTPIDAYCNRGTGGYDYIDVLISNGPVNANLSSHMYENGFELSATVWLGLEHWLKLNPFYTQTIFSIFFDQGQSRVIFYTNFQILNKTNLYRVEYTSKATTDYGNVPGGNWTSRDLTNAPFSTFDQDNDGVPGENCAANNGLGWWYDVTSCDLGASTWPLSDWPHAPQFLPAIVQGSGVPDIISRLAFIQVYIIA